MCFLFYSNNIRKTELKVWWTDCLILPLLITQHGWPIKVVIYRICGLRLGPNFWVWLTAEKNFYLRLTTEKMHGFAAFTEKYLWSYSCSGINFTATINCTNPKTEIQIKSIETQITGMQIYFVIKKIFLLFSGKRVFFTVIWHTYKFPTAPIKNTLKKWQSTKPYDLSCLPLFQFHKQPWIMFHKISTLLQFYGAQKL